MKRLIGSTASPFTSLARVARGALLALAGLAAVAVHATPVAVPNGDFASAGNNGTVGGGLIGASGNHVAIGSGPWLGTYNGVLALLAPPTLTINATQGNAKISGLVGVNALGIVNNGGYFSQALAATLQPNTLYTLATDIDAGGVLNLALLGTVHVGIALGDGTTVLASSDTAAAGLTTLDPLQNTTYRLTLRYTTPASIASTPVELRLFAQPQGVLSASLLPSVTFDNVSLDAIALGVPATVDGVSGGDQAAVVTQPFATSIGLRVVDGVGTPVAGVQVTFTSQDAAGGPALPGGPGATFGSGASSGSPLTVLTDANGVASVSAVANSVAGDYRVSVAVAGITPATSLALTNVAGPPAVIDVSDSGGGSGGATQSTVVATAFAQPLAVRVTDAFGNPAPNASVAYVAGSSTGGASAVLSAATVATGSDGRAAVVAVANTKAGRYPVTAHVDGAVVDATFDLGNLADVAATLSANGASSQETTVNTPFAQPLGVRVADRFDNPVAGIGIAFSVSTGTGGASAQLSSSNAVTGADGVASVGAVANVHAGSYAASAAVSGLGTVGYSLGNLAGATTSVSVAGGGAQSARVHTAFAAPLLVAAQDAFGNPVPNVAIAFAAPSTGAGATLSAALVTTGGNGQASVVATANATAGAYAVTASAAGATVASFALTNTAGLPATVGVAGGSAQQATVDSVFAQPLVVTVADVDGNPVPGILVSFTPPSGSGASAVLSPASATTGNDGRVSVSARANTVAGAYNVTAGVGGVASVASFALTNTAGPATAIELGAAGSGVQTTVVDTAFAQPLTVRVSDSHANPVAGIAVGFGAPASGASAVLSASSVVTGSDGRASVTAMANTVAGHYQVSATIAGVVGAFEFDLTNRAGSAHAIVPVGAGGGTQSTLVNTAFAAPLTVRITDQFDNAVADAAVHYDAPPTGASAVLAAGGQSGASVSIATGADGQASVTATANALAGSYVVNATVDGIAAPFTYHLTNRAKDTVLVIGGGSQTTAVETEFACALIVTLHDPSGAPRAGVPVNFMSPLDGASALLDDGMAAGATSITVTTDADGAAWVQASANAIVGRYAVTAQETGSGSQAVSFSLVNLAAGDPLFGNGFDTPCALSTGAQALAPKRQ